METKKRFKLYKHGKTWCMAALTTVAVMAGLSYATVSANADDTNGTTVQLGQTTSNSATTDSSQATSATTSSSTADSSSENRTQGSSSSTSNNIDSSSSSTTTSTDTVSATGWRNENGTWKYYENGSTKINQEDYVYLPSITGTSTNAYNWYLMGSDGSALSGVQQWAGTYYYFDPVTYLRVDNNYVKSQWGDWYLFGNDGKILTKVQQWAGTYYYFDPVTYLRVDNNYVQSQWGDWYMFGSDGRIVTGLKAWYGSYYYFDPVTYLKVTNKTFTADGLTMTADSEGRITINADLNSNSINKYILDNNLSPAQIVFDYVIPTDLTGSYSGTSDGKPNMVIVHETANPSSNIWSEINYMKNNYDSAFVHAFVNGDNIVVISSTDREAWGAAYPANGRAIQFEQVEVHSAYDFAKELLNAAYFTATEMKLYGMTPSLASSDGSGTLWSHADVSNYLGGTDHTDPISYWSSAARNYFGTTYTMSDFYQLVLEQFSKL
ncbi:N-acetylmuramoyl-L-alanine amidase [Limosilactobacillus gastricus]|nr:N-acetylmuramoyl-L-alanine amidase [Limosilactobacillus gastricus]